MEHRPFRLLLWSEEPMQAPYVETVLEVEAPGSFQVHCCDALAMVGGSCDVVVLVVASQDALEQGLSLVREASEAPIIVVAPWSPTPPVADVHRAMRLGAEDVLGLAELSPRRLVGTLLKAIERRHRAFGAGPNQGMPGPFQALRMPSGGVLAASA